MTEQPGGVPTGGLPTGGVPTAGLPTDRLPTDRVPTSGGPTGTLPPPAGGPPMPPVEAQPSMAAVEGQPSMPAVGGQPGGSELTTTSDRPDEGWRRLSVRMLLVHPVQELRRAILPLLVLVFLGRGDHNLWPYIGVGLVVALGLIRWLTTTYRVTPTQVQLRHGLLGRSTLSVPRDRVRSVDITSHLMHRLLGLARLTIGTGQSDRRRDDALRLDALTLGAAERLRAELLHERDVALAGAVAIGEVPAAAGPPGPPLPPPERELARLDPAWVRYAPFTLSGLVTIGVVAGFVINAANQARVNLLDSDAVRSARADLTHLPLVGAIAVTVLFVIVVVALLSAGGYVLAYWGFKLSRQGGTLHVTRGLLTTRATTIEARRLRGAEISEPLLLRWVRGARATAITTGLRVGRGAERGGTVLLPAAPAGEVTRVAAEVLETPVPTQVRLERHGPRARRRRFNRVFLIAAFLTVVLGLLWRFAGWPVGFPIAALAIFPIGIPLALDRYASLGHALVGGFVVARQGSLIRRRYMLATAGIIGWNEQRSFFQRRAGLVTLVATTAAGKQHYEIQDVAQPEATALADAATPGLLTPFLATPAAVATAPREPATGRERFAGSGERRRPGGEPADDGVS